MTSIPDLWGHAISVDVLTPAAILNTQAALLKRKTQGIVIAELETTTDSKNVVTIKLDLVAPAVDSFRASVLAVRHKADYVYPALVSTAAFAGKGGGTFGDLAWGGVEDRMSQLAETETQFVSFLQDALQSGFILSIVQSLIAKSNEARRGPPLAELVSGDAAADATT